MTQNLANPHFSQQEPWCVFRNLIATEILSHETQHSFQSYKESISVNKNPATQHSEHWCFAESTPVLEIYAGATKSQKRKTLKNHSVPSQWIAVKWKGHSGNSFFRFHFLIYKSADHAHPFLHSPFPITNLSWQLSNLPYGRVNPFRKTRGYFAPHHTDLS